MPDIKPYRNILAVVDLDRNDEAVVHQAQMLARACGAQLGLLHIAEIESSSDDGAPALTPCQAALAYEAIVMQRLQALAVREGLTEAQCHARCGNAALSFKTFAASWQPDLLITARRAQHLANGPWDVLVLKPVQGHWLARLKSWFGYRPATLSVTPSTA